MGLRFIKPSEDINQVFNDELASRGLKQGDRPNLELTSLDFLKPVLVENNDEYLDCEYQLEYNGKIYSEEQINAILKELGVK